MFRILQTRENEAFIRGEVTDDSGEVFQKGQIRYFDSNFVIFEVFQKGFHIAS